jgi:hypothetical protein
VGSSSSRRSRRRPGAERLALVALGALLYTVVNSSGYFAEAGVWAMVAVFGLLALLSLAAVTRLLTTAR